MIKRTVSGLLLAVCVFGLAACKPKKPAGAAQAGEEWYRYISAFTSGAVSRKSSVRVLFVDDAAAPGPAAAGLLEFSPALAGKAEWRSPRELVFTPRDEMKPGQDYKAVLRVGKVLDLPKAYARFAFGFSVIRPNLEVDVDGLFAEDPDRPQSQVLRGHVVTADAEESILVEKVLGAEQGGRTLTIEWSHAPLGLVHAFAVRGIERGEEASAVALEWDGGPIRIDNRGRRAYEVPAKGEFKVVSIEPVLGETRHVLVRFSDALAADQSLKGLLVVEDHPLTFEIEGNVVRAYSSRELVGTVDVQVLSGIRNLLDRRLAEGLDRQITFESIRPQVRFVGRGLVLPRRDRLTVPIEAVNLKSVQVAAFQIYPGNMAQFFQVNSLEGGEELARVGRYLWRKTVPLSDDQAVTGKWSRYDLDVTPLFKENPGSLFRIVLSMNRGNSTYPCPPSDAPVVVEPPVKNMDDLGYGRWANWDYDDEGYDYGWGEWRNRDNPCSDAYFLPRYNREAVAGRNFFASDIGLVAKLEAGGTLRVVTTDIGTARPLSGLKVRAYNYQNRLLGETASDGNGFAVLALEDRPFYVSAEGGGDIGYLRVSSEGVLALSHFDVGGEITQKGVKGIVYGERGVWRPGDTLHLTFALFDRDEVLPEGHPVLMELYSPQGQLVGTLKPEKIVEPFYAFRAETDEAAPTGNWRARVLVGGLTFEKTLKIETVVPNRLKIALDAGRETLVRKDMPFEAAVTAQWLHGAPAANLKYDVSVRLSRRATRFDRYPDYAFDDPARDFEGGTVEAAEGVLDAGGKARARIDIKPQQPSPGLLDAAFTSRVFEESGDFSVDTFSLPFHPYDSYVGVRVPQGDRDRGLLVTDKDHQVDIVTVDPSGRPVSRDKVVVSLYQIEWRWWWERSGESLAQYVSNVQTRPIAESTVSTRDGAGRWTFKIRYPGWGRFLVRAEDPVSGHATGQIVYVDWPGWAGRAREEGGPGATALSFTADKPSYKVGEKAVIFLPEAVQGRALVSIESGTSVLDMMWVPTVKGENRFEIPLTAAMAPNVYVHVTLLQPHRDKTSDAPIRLYGVIPLLVEDPATKLEPAIKMADEIKPRERFKVEVRESGGRPMSYTLAVVDEGLLGLTRFATPDLRKGFYSREALGVRTWDLFDLVAEAYGAEMARILAIGGDESADSKDKAKQPRRFPPVVLFDGPFELKAGGSGVHELTMPQYFGAVRVMVVAGRGGAFGWAERSVPVRRDLMALATLPRVVRPGEDVVMPVTVFVDGSKVKEVTLAVETNGLFEVVGERTKTVAFAKPGDQIVTFALKSTGGIGTGEVRYRATGGDERIEDAISIPVLASNALITQTTHLEIGPGKTRQPGGRAVRAGEHERRHDGGLVPAAAQSREAARLSHPVSARLPRADALGGLPSALPQEPGQARRRGEARGRGERQGGGPEADRVPDDQWRLLVLAGREGRARVDDRLRRLLPARGGQVRLPRAPGHARRLAGQSETARQRFRHRRRFGQAHPGFPAVRAGPGPRSGPRGHEPAPRERRASRPGRDDAGRGLPDDGTDGRGGRPGRALQSRFQAVSRRQRYVRLGVPRPGPGRPGLRSGGPVGEGQGPRPGHLEDASLRPMVVHPGDRVGPDGRRGVLRQLRDQAVPLPLRMGRREAGRRLVGDALRPARISRLPGQGPDGRADESRTGAALRQYLPPGRAPGRGRSGLVRRAVDRSRLSGSEMEYHGHR